jgi:hypothetical protein
MWIDVPGKETRDWEKYKENGRNTRVCGVTVQIWTAAKGQFMGLHDAMSTAPDSMHASSDTGPL